MVANNKDTNILDKMNRTPLFYSMLQEDIKILRVLLDNNALVSLVNLREIKDNINLNVSAF